MNKLIAFLLMTLFACAQAHSSTITLPTPACNIQPDPVASGIICDTSDFSLLASPGDPALLYTDLKLIMPPDADPLSVSVSIKNGQSSILDGTYDIKPTPPITTIVDGIEVLDWGPDKSIESGRNIHVYGKDAFFPSEHVQLLSHGSMRGWQIATVRYFPYLYNPISRRLALNTGGEIILSYTTRSGISVSSVTRPDNVLSDHIRRLTVNYPEALNWYNGSSTTVASTTPSGGYMIITTSAIANTSTKLAAFMNHKTNRGFAVFLATESQWGGGTGDTAANNIRAYLKANYLSKSIKYVLFIGNPNPTTGDVPMKMLYPRNNTGSYREAPSDYFFADLTGNWDRDGDGFFGESDNDFGSGGIDIYPEVIIGRIPFYGSISDLDSILQKFINYETGAIGGPWVQNVLLSMKPSDTNTPGYHLGEAIKNDFVVPAGFSSTRVYEENYSLSPNPEYKPCTYDTVLSAWQGRAGFHFWWTHGSETSAADIMSSSRTQYLDNNYPSFVFQCSCLNGYPENPSNLGYSLLRQGAIATTSASRVSWYYPGQVTFTGTDSNAGMTYQYARRLVKDHMPCGDAHFDMMINIPNLIWMNHCVFNLYGDPSIAYASGPAINHTPPSDTDKTTGSYPITASVTTHAPLAPGYPLIKWNTTGGSTFNTTPMALTSGASYTGSIPAQSLGTKVYYYVAAQDTAGRSAVNPGGAPNVLHSFNISSDTQAPVITHTALPNTGNTSGPYEVTATVTDNRSVASVQLFYRKNGGAESSISMTSVGDDQYCASIPGPASTGDTISYRITATDASANANKAYSPASGYHSFSILGARRVAVYNCSTSPPYFYGSNSNSYISLCDILRTDPAQRYSVSEITDLSQATLANYDAIVFPDNGPTWTDHQNILGWFTNGKTIVTMETSSCYAAYSGFLWPDAAGTNGFYTYWDYNAGNNDQVIALADPITAGYTVGQVVESKGYKAQFYINKLPGDVKILSTSQYDPTRAYAVYREVPGKGRIVALGPYISVPTSLYTIVRNAPDGPSGPPIIPTPPGLQIISPNGGEFYNAGDVVNITWQATGDWPAGAVVNLEFTAGSVWTPIPGAASVAYDSGSFAWNTAGLAPGSAYRVRASHIGGTVTDQSDAAFSLIQTQKTVSITQPTGSATYTVGQSIQITWQLQGPWNTSEQMKLEYCTGLDSTWRTIPGADAITVSSTGFQWFTSELPGSSTYRVRATPADGSVTGNTSSEFTLLKQLTASTAKSTANGEFVQLTGKSVVGVGSGFCYLEETNRSSGIRVRNLTGISKFSLITVTGTMNTVNGERVVDAQSVSVDGTQSVTPFYITTTSLCGGNSGLQNGTKEYKLVNGVLQLSTVTGRNNVGLLARVSGTVTASGSGFFYVDDGARCLDGSGYVGVRVSCPGLLPPTKGKYVQVTGVSSPWYNQGYLLRGMLVSSQGDIRVIQ